MCRMKPAAWFGACPAWWLGAGLADKILPLDQIAAEIVHATVMQIATRTQG
jgi:hypothetical protein